MRIELRRAAILSLVLLWVWVAFTASSEYYLVKGDEAIPESLYRDLVAAGGPPAERLGRRYVELEREFRVDHILLVWFLLPPVLVSPLLWQFWRKSN